MFENDSGVLLKKADSQEITNETIINDNIEAPISSGDILGKVNFYVNNNFIKSVSLVSQNDISKKNFINIFQIVSSNWINLLRKKD